VWRTALPLLTVAALLGSLPGVAAGERRPGPARMTGQYRVVYHALGKAKPFGTRIWGVKPVCKKGACAIDVTSRAKGAKTDGTIRFALRGSTYVRSERDPGFSDCVGSSGTVIAIKVYTREIAQHLVPTNVSRLGRTLAFKGQATYTYTASAAARAHGCRTSVQRYTFTGTAVGG
jgi:hypothetical protein